MPSDLVPRLLSALVLATLTLIVIWLGGWIFAFLLFAGSVIVALEWTMLAGRKWHDVYYIIHLITLCLVFYFLIISPSWLYVLASFAGGFIAALVLQYWRGDVRWMAFGLPVLIGAAVLLLELRQMDMALVFWLFLAVWASDSGAYFAGRFTGGRLLPDLPKRLKALSPNKTFEGVAGGFLAAALAGAAFAWLAGWPVWLIAGLSLFLSLAAQAGDFAESTLKRRAGAKDASALIPGHGGLLDRIDGLIAATYALAPLLLLFS